MGRVDVSEVLSEQRHVDVRRQPIGALVTANKINKCWENVAIHILVPLHQHFSGSIGGEMRVSIVSRNQ